jgi:hypothetical protein
MCSADKVNRPAAVNAVRHSIYVLCDTRKTHFVETEEWQGVHVGSVDKVTAHQLLITIKHSIQTSDFYVCYLREAPKSAPKSAHLVKPEDWQGPHPKLHRESLQLPSMPDQKLATTISQ